MCWREILTYLVNILSLDVRGDVWMVKVFRDVQKYAFMVWYLLKHTDNFTFPLH